MKAQISISSARIAMEIHWKS